LFWIIREISIVIFIFSLLLFWCDVTFIPVTACYLLLCVSNKLFPRSHTYLHVHHTLCLRVYFYIPSLLSFHPVIRVPSLSLAKLLSSLNHQNLRVETILRQCLASRLNLARQGDANKLRLFTKFINCC
jgi:hypothetical protein